MTNVTLENIEYRYANVPAADSVSLDIQSGEFFALLGPSGSGKTTILRLIAGFIKPQAGRILMDGEDVQELAVYKRQIGFVFQNFALFPHMTVEQNIAFGLESQRVPRQLMFERIHNVLEMVQLQGMQKRRPSQLSGGQQQRVAFARAIVTEPRVLLLDEPLASLDRKLRVEMQVELRQLQQRLKITTLFVTHDQEEALTLADRIAVMQTGRIEQVGHPLDVYARPHNRFIGEFLGLSNLFTGQIIGYAEQHAVVQLPNGLKVRAQNNERFGVGDSVQMIVRPEQMVITTDKPVSSQHNSMRAFIGHISFAGVSLTYHLYGDQQIALTVFEQSSLNPTPPALGTQVFVSWLPDYTVILNDAPGAAVSAPGRAVQNAAPGRIPAARQTSAR
ncbi:MAG: ABC transporter ATP-binding protein [bacterium]|nr:ABC transporter ATP-binding protein [bacterium]